MTVDKKLDQLYTHLKKLKRTFLGYPCDAEFDYSKIYRFLEFPINNAGDPFEQSKFHLQTKKIEVEVLDFFAKLLHIKDYWGYVTNGGTEGNLYGLYLAREHLPKAKVFFSDHTHYSIKKNVHILGMKFQIIKTDNNGEMDYNDLKKKTSKVKSAIIVANIGSTMFGAIDSIEKISSILKSNKTKTYIHADAALYGMVLPFISKIKFDFRTGINSIAISGHKFLGSPIPCGIVLTKKDLIQPLESYIQYINAHDTTISGSRDAFTPLVFWYRIKTLGKSGFKKQVKYSNDLANYLTNQLRNLKVKDVGQSYITVRFKAPSQKMINKWELPVSNEIAHVICLPHATKKILNEFIDEFKNELK